MMKLKFIFLSGLILIGFGFLIFPPNNGGLKTNEKLFKPTDIMVQEGADILGSDKILYQSGGINSVESSFEDYSNEMEREYVSYQGYLESIDSHSDLNYFLDNKIEHSDNVVDLVIQYREAIVNDDLNKIRGLIEFFVGTELEGSALRSALEVAFVRGDRDLILYLVNIGGIVSEHHLRLLVYSKNIELMRQLENSGVQLFNTGTERKYDNLALMNYLIYTNLSQDSTQNPFFDYFIGSGADLSADGVKVDPLYLSLRFLDSDTSGRSLYYAKKLVERGATIKPEHISIMKKLSLENGLLYSKVVNEIPQLNCNCEL